MVQQNIPSAPNTERRPEAPLGVINDLGGEPLDFSGFEDEDPEPDFDEGADSHA